MLTHEERRSRRREIAEFSKTHTDYQTAAEFGVCRDTVVAARRAFGIRKDSECVVNAPSTYQILACLLRGESQSDIARSLVVSRQRVNQIKQGAKAAGIFALFKRQQQKPKRSKT